MGGAEASLLIKQAQYQEATKLAETNKLSVITLQKMHISIPYLRIWPRFDLPQIVKISYCCHQTLDA